LIAFPIPGVGRGAGVAPTEGAKMEGGGASPGTTVAPAPAVGLVTDPAPAPDPGVGVGVGVGTRGVPATVGTEIESRTDTARRATINREGARMVTG
jgi:hypothetical protein